jgi:hypothetical protein
LVHQIILCFCFADLVDYHVLCFANLVISFVIDACI